MALSRGWQFWRNDEEMAKKDDDLPLPGHAPGHGKPSVRWKATRVSRRPWARRIMVYVFIIVALLYLFNRRDPSFPTSEPLDADRDRYRGYVAEPELWSDSDVRNDLPHRRGRTPAKTGEKSGRKSSSKASPAQPAEYDGTDAEDGRSEYDGPIRFPMLSLTLDAITATGGLSPHNRNVLFAAASLESASTLLPMACEMAMERQNYVHFTYMGTANISLTELLELNGINKDCQLIVHDARPDHFESSTVYRTQRAITRVLYFLNTYMHPQVVFIDSTTAEEDYFLGPARDQILSTDAALIELPERPRKSLSWISKLDTSALSAWNKVRFDILIRATPTKSANLKRLLRSIARADLTGIHTPHITVEMPSTVDDSLQSFLESFKWPRPSPYSAQQPQMISLHRRITRHPLDEEDSSVRFVESFWPTDPGHTHVLVLSSHTELTPQFFQYVKYSLLQQLYSKMAAVESYDSKLMGLSFSVPFTLVDGTTAFSPPTPEGKGKNTSGQTAFLWQRPNSEAMLFMGKKWIELHHLISQTLYRQKTMSSTPALLTKKKVGKGSPAWLEYALLLSRIRGYYTIYPSKSTANTILGVHREIPDPPEEYQRDVTRQASLASLRDESKERFDAASPVNMLETLSDKGELQSPVELPLLSWDGKPIRPSSLDAAAQEYAELFRKQVGGCSEEDERDFPMITDPVADMFCEKKATDETVSSRKRVKSSNV